jgi:predicted RNA-binding Zn ribbon-like protein
MNLTETRGEPCLDFVNTVSWRGRKFAHDQLQGYGELLEWGRQSGVITQDQCDEISGMAFRSPGTAAEAHRKTIEFREALHRILSATIDVADPSSSDMARVNAVLTEALSSLVLEKEGDTYKLLPRKEEAYLDSVVWGVALSAAELLTSERLRRLKRCASEECGWLFLDGSKNQSRRWCDMKDCGNRMKAQRHYHRKMTAPVMKP